MKMIRDQDHQRNSQISLGGWLDGKHKSHYILLASGDELMSSVLPFSVRFGQPGISDDSSSPSAVRTIDRFVFTNSQPWYGKERRLKFATGQQCYCQIVHVPSSGFAKWPMEDCA